MLSSVVEKALGRFRGSTSARNSMWSLVGVVGRATLSLFVFFAIGRALDTDGYGVFAGVVAFATLIAPLNTMGIGEMLSQTVSRDRTAFAHAWGQVLTSAASIGLLVFVVSTAVAWVLFDTVPLKAIALLTAMEFLSMAVLANNSRACCALDRYAASAGHQIGEGAARALAAGIFWASGSEDVSELALLLLVAVAISAVISMLFLVHTESLPQLTDMQLLTTAKAGAPFALGQSSTAMQTNVDKAMLLAYGFEADNGIYAAGFRLIGYSTMPMMSIFQATLPEFYRHGNDGISTAMLFSRKIARPVLATAVLGAVGGVCAAPIAAWALAGQFGGVVPVALSLAGFPIIKGMQLLYADVLTGSGRQQLRARLQFLTAGLNVALNLYLIPAYSWKGAVASTYVSEVAFLLLVFLGVRQARSQTKQGIHLQS